MCKKILILNISLLIGFNTLIAGIPEVFINDSLDWVKYEIEKPLEEKTLEIKKIEDEILYYFEDNDNLEENIKNFHFLDFDIDGLIDIIYVGYAGSESISTILFRNINHTKYLPVLKVLGRLFEISKPFPISPISFKIIVYPCCDEKTYSLKLYNPIITEKGIEFNLVEEIRYFKGTQMPAEFSFNKQFKTINPIYYLRTNPELSETNIIAEYNLESVGYALTESIDSTGRVWWFAVMLNNIPPSKSLIYNEKDKIKSYSFGWLSSRYVEEIK